MIFLIALLVAIAALTLAYELMPMRREVAAEQFREVAGVQEETVPLAQALVLPIAGLVGRYAPASSVHGLNRRLYWVHFQGKWRGWNGAMVYGAMVCLGLLGVVVMFLTRNVILGILVGFVGALFPYSRLQGATEQILREIQRSLPDVADRLALAVTGGSTIETSIREVGATYPGFLGEFLRRAELEAQSSGQRYLTVLQARAKETGQPGMISLFVKLAEIERQGVDAAKRLLGLATDMQREYMSAAQERVRGTPGKTMPIIIIFFLVPYLLLALAPLAVNVLTLLQSGR